MSRVLPILFNGYGSGNTGWEKDGNKAVNETTVARYMP